MVAAAEQRERAGAKHLVIWDGECGFCRRSVEWVMSRDVRGEFEAISFQAAPSPPMTPALREACARAVHVYTRDGRMLRAGRASLFILERIGWPRLARIASYLPFVWFVELGYALIARNRAAASRLTRARSRSA